MAPLNPAPTGPAEAEQPPYDHRASTRFRRLRGVERYTRLGSNLQTYSETRSLNRFFRSDTHDSTDLRPNRVRRLRFLKIRDKRPVPSDFADFEIIGLPIFFALRSIPFTTRLRNTITAMPKQTTSVPTAGISGFINARRSSVRFTIGFGAHAVDQPNSQDAERTATDRCQRHECEHSGKVPDEDKTEKGTGRGAHGYSHRPRTR